MTTTSVESYAMIAGKTEVAASGLINRIEGVYAEEHRARTRTTEYPVETGADLTDHVVREPYRLKLKGTATEFHGGEGSALNAWAAVLKHIGERRPVAVVTRLGTYHNMILVDTKAPIDESTGLSLDFEMEFKEVLRANVTRDEPTFGGTPIVGPAVDRTPPIRLGRTLPLAVLFARRKNLNAVSRVQLPLAVIEENLGLLP